MSTTHKELANAAEANRIICNDATEYCQLFAAHLANSELTPPLTTALVGRIVRSKIDIHASLLADEPGRDIVFCLPSDSLNQSAKLNQVDQILPSLGFPRQEIVDYKENGYQFYLVVFPNSEVYPADWSSIRQLFCEKYPPLVVTVDLLWQAATTTPFNQIDKSITLEAFSNLPLQLRTAQQLRGLLYSIWRLNKDFTGTGLTSGGVPEMLMPNQPIASLADACWIKLSV